MDQSVLAYVLVSMGVRPSSSKCTATSSNAVHATQEHFRQSQLAQ